MQTLAQHPPTSFLDAIVTPAELKKLSINELRSLAQEIRSEIVRNLNVTGGHLASNLGIVEITLALHFVFDTPKDQILWDVGHQAYVHKMLTGRRDRFNTLRQFKGLSGFISPAESEHDAFVAGHSSTSVSLGVGMAIARDHLKQDHKVIALIGDGGLTGGMALEALNHLGHIQRDVLILLNDNEMSISENMGGLSQYMKRIKETFFYKDIKQKITLLEDQLDGMSLTPDVWKLIESVKHEATERIDTPGIVFEKLGVNYSGPIDGHDVGAIIEVFNKVKDEKVPLIAHCITQKGKGFDPAERDSIKYHGVKKSFSLEPRVEPAAEKKAKASKTYSDVFSETLIELASVEPNLVAITPATAEGSGLVKFGKVYPDRFFDVAICEQHAVTMAAGMAKAGLKPVVSIYSTFLQRAMDQVIHDVAIMNLPVLFGIDRGGLVEDGETHQGVFDIAYMRSIPNFTVLAPKDAAELRNMIYTVMTDMRGPVAIRFPRDEAFNADAMKSGIDGFEKIDFSKWEIVQAGSPIKGTDNKVVLLAFGSMVKTAIDASALLKQHDLDVTIVNARSVKPLDVAMLNELFQNAGNKLITLEEGCLSGGFGAAVLEFRAQMRMNNPGLKLAEVAPLGVPDNFIEHGNRNILLDEVGLSHTKIAEFVQKYVQA